MKTLIVSGGNVGKEILNKTIKNNNFNKLGEKKSVTFTFTSDKELIKPRRKRLKNHFEK